MSYVGELVEALKRPAIEAYMASVQGFMGSGTVHGTDFGGVERSATGYVVDRGNIHLVISPPDHSGYGGGRIAVWNSSLGGLYTLASEVASWSDGHEFMHAFDEVRARIDRAFGRWLDLPQAVSFDSQVTQAVHALRRLQLDLEQVQSWLAGGSYPEYQLGSDLSAELATVGRILTDDVLFAGLTLDTVKHRYASGAQRAVAGLYAMSTVCGGHIAAEQRLWANGRQDLFLVLGKAQEGFAQSTNVVGAVDWTIALSVLGVAVKGLALIADASGVGIGAGLALGGIGLAIDTLSSATSDEETLPPIRANYDSVMSAIETSLADLASTIRHEEGLIASNIEANLRHIRDDATKYDLTGVMFDDNDERNAAIRFDLVSAPSVSVAMRRVSDELEAAARYFPFLDVTTACQRDPSVGLGGTGPASQIEEFAHVIERLLKALSVEFSLGAGNWDAATHLFAEQDSAVQGIVTALESQLDLTPFAGLGASPSIIDPLMSVAESGEGRS